MHTLACTSNSSIYLLILNAPFAWMGKLSEVNHIEKGVNDFVQKWDGVGRVKWQEKYGRYCNPTTNSHRNRRNN